MGGQNVKESGDTNWLLIFSISQSTVSFGVLLFFLACFISWRTRKASGIADSACASPRLYLETDEIIAGESLTHSLSRKLSAFIVCTCYAFDRVTFISYFSQTMIRDIYSSPTVVIWSCWYFVNG